MQPPTPLPWSPERRIVCRHHLTVDLGVGSLSIATDTRSLIMTGNVGDTAITGSLGTTTVTDNRGTLAGWTAT